MTVQTRDYVTELENWVGQEATERGLVEFKYSVIDTDGQAAPVRPQREAAIALAMLDYARKEP